MATKKKHKKRVGGTHRRKRHKVGAIKPGSIEHYALMGVGVLGGAVLGAYGVQAITTAVGSSTPPVVAPLIVAAAGVVPMAIGGGNPLTDGVGAGMLAIGGIMAANQTFLNVPGISGMSMTSNAPAGTPVIRTSIGQGPKAYIDQTVGYMSRKQRTMGAVASN
jgi:hypothetical protein